jgi:hypothetical protein
VSEDAARVIASPDLGLIAPGRLADAVVIESDVSDPYDALLSANRAAIALVVKDGRLLVADEGFRAAMESTSGDPATIGVDGRVKWCPRGTLGPDGAGRLEPGLEVLS